MAKWDLSSGLFSCTCWGFFQEDFKDPEAALAGWAGLGRQTLTLPSADVEGPQPSPPQPRTVQVQTHTDTHMGRRTCSHLRTCMNAHARRHRRIHTSIDRHRCTCKLSHTPTHMCTLMHTGGGGLYRSRGSARPSHRRMRMLSGWGGEGCCPCYQLPISGQEEGGGSRMGRWSWAMGWGGLAASVGWRPG